MKKYIISLVALLTLVSGTVYATQNENGGPNRKREIGAPGFVPYKEFQLVRFGENAPNGTSLTLSDVVTWDCVSDDGVTVGLVGTPNSIDAVAGVVVSTVIQTVETTGTTPGVDYGRRNWGYIQVKGFNNDINIINGPALAGGALIASTTARNATAANSNAGGTNHVVLGFAYDASSDTSEAQINL